MKEKRSLFNMVFGKQQQQQPMTETHLQLLNSFMPIFTPFGDNPYESDTVRSAIDAIARNAAKLKPKHIRRVDRSIKPQDSNIQYLLQVRPNKYMDAYTFYYKVITLLFLNNNSFVFMDVDPISNNIQGFYPINSNQIELLEYENEVYVKFRFLSGSTITLPYENIIHLRRFFCNHDFYGESNNVAMNPTLQLINTTNQGIINAIKSSAFLRGLLKFTSMLKPEDLKKQRDIFIQDYMNINNNGGVAATDSKADYIELKNDPKMINGQQMDLIEQKVYKYFGVSKEIVMSNYTEDQWNAFYESTLEPLAIQLSLEFTYKIFTEREQGFGNEIIFESNRLQYASNTTKTNMLKELIPMSIFTINEGREILNMAPVEGGDKRVQSLNYVDADKANQYQGVGGDKNNVNNNSKEGNPNSGTPGSNNGNGGKDS